MNSMSEPSPLEDRVASQFETGEPQLRVVLLGASNLSIMFPTIVESLRGVGTARYYAFREVLFPNCKLSRGEIINRAERLSERLAQLAATREISAFSAERGWYGLDPIHPRLTSAGEIWSRMLGALGGVEGGTKLVRPSAAMMLTYRRLRALEYAHFGVVRRAEQPALRCLDGTRISIY